MKNIKKEVKKLSLCISAFIRKSIIEKINYKDRLVKLEKRLERLENSK